ncbi:methyltransferase domain protein [Clostridiales bacterium oral taxon 876 str. F0540]|nr:methyltransferase domain protein [Clostridiales bacterium oral taxon 876 str. F0540]
MYKEILDLLKCPKCNGELSLTVEKEENGEIIDGKLSCKDSHDWVIRDGVINFGSVEQELSNNWTEAYEQYDDEEMDKKLSEGIPKNQIIIGDNAKKFIIDKINNRENKYILDIATGRGALFTEILKELKGESQIICTDLSFIVLKYDRLKAKKVNPKVKVNYIACDATSMPFKENSIDTVVSFCGIQNMLSLAADGIKEAKRVLKRGHSLFDSYVIIKENSEGFKTLKEFCKENNVIGAEEFALRSGIEKAYAEAGFDNINITTTGESIGEKNEFDLMPFEGEWFAMVVAEGMK